MTACENCHTQLSDLSEHYNFRNTGGESTAANSYDHLEENYRKALESLDKEISLLEDRLLEIDAKDKEVLQKELEGLRNKRSALKEEAELQADLLNFY